jgi:hypothetical protein
MEGLVVQSNIFRLRNEKTALGAALLVTAGLAHVLTINGVVRIQHQRRSTPFTHKLLWSVRFASRLDRSSGHGHVKMILILVDPAT